MHCALCKEHGKCKKVRFKVCLSFYSPGKRKSTADEDVKTEEMSEKETKKPKVENEEKSEEMETDDDKRYVLNE